MHVLIEEKGKQNLGQRPFRLIIQGRATAVSFHFLCWQNHFTTNVTTTLTSTVDDHIIDAWWVIHLIFLHFHWFYTGHSFAKALRCQRPWLGCILAFGGHMWILGHMWVGCLEKRVVLREDRAGLHSKSHSQKFEARARVSLPCCMAHHLASHVASKLLGPKRTKGALSKARNA